MKEIENQVNELLDYIKEEFFKGREDEFEARRRSLVHVKMTKPMPAEKNKSD